MHVLLFEPRFVELVRSGKKQHTIRGYRKRPIQVGHFLSLRRWKDQPYRSQQERIIESSVRAVSVQDIMFTSDNGIEIDGVQLKLRQAQDLAVEDGFGSLVEMIAWHYAAHGLPFNGVLIRWELPE